LNFSKCQAITTIITVVFVFFAIFIGPLLQNGGVNRRLVVFSLLPSILLVGSIYYFFKKIKLMDDRNSKKMLYFVLATILVFLGTSAANIGIISKFTGLSNEEMKTTGNFSVENEPISLLTEKCQYLEANDHKLKIRKTV